MGETNHTPTGEWTAYESAGFKGLWGVQSNDPALVSAGDEIIVYPSLCEDHARLIAAAPSLLKALRNLSENVEHAWPALAELQPLKTSRAVIARAEGRSE